MGEAEGERGSSGAITKEVLLVVVAGGGPVGFGDQRFAQVVSGRELPIVCRASSRAVAREDGFQCPLDGLIDGPIILGGKLLGAAEKFVGNLDLGFAHDGKVPCRRRDVDFGRWRNPATKIVGKHVAPGIIGSTAQQTFLFRQDNDGALIAMGTFGLLS